MSEPALLRQPNRRRTALVVAAGLLAVGVAGGAWYFLHNSGASGPPTPGRVPPPEGPRLTYDGPFRNIAPDVKYVGSASCGGSGCHDSKIASFRHHPMGRTIFPSDDADPVPPEDVPHHIPFEAFGSQFRIEHTGRTIRHHRTAFDESGHLIYDSAFEAAYAIGSGSHGFSYLAVLEGGYIVETPISWYSHTKIWDVSAGFSAGQPGRPVSGDCLYCHSNQTELIEGTVNRYKEPIFNELAIGCERCHGPGEKHVAARRNAEPIAGDVDYTIVNPGRLPPTLREAVCEQCHLTGEIRVVRRGRQRNEFRPGLRLEDFVTVLVRAADAGQDDRAVTHVEQMHVSRCFRESPPDKKLGCVSCHDPHVHVVEPAQRIRHYRNSCLSCHKEHPCSEPLAKRIQTSKEDSCIDCHMPGHPLGNVPHTAGTDHRILRKHHAGNEPNYGQWDSNRALPVRPFHAPAGEPLGPELDRDLGIGLMKGVYMASDEGGKPFGDIQLNSMLARRRLEEAVVRDPEDWDAWQGKATALMISGDMNQALAAVETVLAHQPRRENALMQAALMSQVVGRPEQAIEYWLRAIEVNPWQPFYRQSLCQALVKKEVWDELRPQCESWLRLDPASIDARQTWVNYLLHAGRKNEARAEFAKVRALRPQNLDTLQEWFDEELRKR